MKFCLHELRQSLAKNKKRIGLCVLGYLATGYAVATGMYLYSHPEYLYYGRICELITDTAMNDQFWLAVLIWPIALYSYLRVEGVL